MSALFDLLSQQTPTLQTKRGLIILDLQNDFISPTGKLPVRDTGFLEPLSELVTSFREHGDVIWIRSQFERTRPINALESDGDSVIAGGSSGKEAEMQATEVNESEWRSSDASEKSRFAEPTATSISHDDGEKDEELFLSRTAEREPCVMRGSSGAEYFPSILPLIQEGKDLQTIKTHYSAFSSTSLLLTLRGRLITELYICGCITNLSVYATAMDAARYGISVTLVDDCLGYRREDRHNSAIEQLREHMEATATSSTQILQDLRGRRREHIHSSMATGQFARPHNALTALEADSDDEEDEDEEVIPSRLFDPRVELHVRSMSNKYSPRVLARERASTEHAESSESRRDNSTEPEPTDQANRSEQKRDDYAASKLCSPGGNSGKLNSHDSCYNKSWLDRIAPIDIPRPKHPAPAAMTAAASLSPSTVAEIVENMQRATMEDDQPQVGTAISRPLFGDDKEAESAGSRIMYNLLPTDIAETIFAKLNAEVDWGKMYHILGEVPRLVCCQGTIGDDGSMPIYRHPSDHTIPIQKWSPTVELVRQAAEQAVGHPLNHVLIQLYRSGTDFISEHSDKTLDIVPGSNIVNVSFGAQRTMRLRTKRGAPANGPDGARTTYRIPTPHNSMITMSLKTNAQYLHGISADKRPRCELVEDEKAFDGQRISCTFRQIGTFINEDSSMIWGQGAIGKTRQEAREVINGDVEQSEKLVRAFGSENSASTIEWEQIYGQGFDVLHLKAIQGLTETK